jgi:hypothetical protein
MTIQTGCQVLVLDWYEYSIIRLARFARSNS